MSKLALCIPAYNAARFLPRLLASASHQKVPFDEILLYDDCSTDNTGEVARALGATVVRGERNLGCSAGKNRMLAVTRCEWVHFHDADDDLTPEFTTLAHKWMAQDVPPDVVLFNYESRRFEDEQLLFTRNFDPAALSEEPQRYSVRTQINPYCGLYKTEALKRLGGYDVDPEVLYNEDCRFHMRLAFGGLTFGVEPLVSVINLERAGSMSGANRAKCAVSRLAVLRKAAIEGGPRVRREVGLEAWLTARQLGYYGRFAEMAQAIRLARDMGVHGPAEETSLVVRSLGSVLPEMTFLGRAKFVAWRDALLRLIGSQRSQTSSIKK